MAENTVNEATQSEGPTGDAARRDVHNALVLALLDGDLSQEEKAHVESLRSKAGMSAAEFTRLCDEFRDGDRRILLPASSEAAVGALAELVKLAVADGKVSPAEHRALRKIAEHIGLRTGMLDEMLAEASGPPGMDDIKMAALVEQIYQGFGQWDAETRRRRVAALGELGPCAVKPLVRILESYRKPDGTADALALKMLVAEQLGHLGDTRPVYYLAQQVTIGNTDDEITNADLRAAAAEAIGRILDMDFPRTAEGTAAVRQWWQDQGAKKYDYLVY